MGILSVVLAILFCSIPFAIYLFVMLSLHHKIGSWYSGRVKALNDKDMSVFMIRNMLYGWLIFGIFLAVIVAYLIFRPSFVDPSWFCILFAGFILAILLFQASQFAWLHYRTRNSKKQ